LYKSLKDKIKNHSDMFQILCDPSSGSTELCEPLRVIPFKQSSLVPDDGSHKIRNMLE